MMNWDEARAWEELANKEKQIIEIEPRWSWDCGLKLDYDGGLLRVSSRFYQQRENIFDGSVSFLIGDDEVFNKEFSCRHIDILKVDVEKYVQSVTNNVKQLLLSDMSVFIAQEKDNE